MTQTIVFQPQPGFQVDFCQAGEKEVFTGGEAGGGKSLLLIMEALRYQPVSGYKGVIFRRTYPDLEDLIGEARQIYCAYPLGAIYNSSTHNFTFPNGSVIMFRHLQHLKNIYSHQGKQYDFIGFDELPHFPKVAYTYLFSRLRGKNPNIKRYIRATGNPDGEFVVWVKQRFVTSMPPNVTRYFKTIADKDVEVPKGTKGAISRRFVPCIRGQNKVLMENDPDYEDMLDQLSEAQKRALKDGKWDTVDKPDQLIATKWWENALNGKNEYVDDGYYTIGCDFGHTGTDPSVEILGKGNRPYRCKTWKMTKTTQMADILAATAQSVAKNRTMVGVDCIGPGAGVGDAIEDYHSWLADKLERCVHKDPDYAPRYKGEIQFDNLRSQMWWCFREDMQDGLIDLSAFMDKKIPPDGQNWSQDMMDEGYFDDLNLMMEEVLAHTFRIFNGKLIVIPKSELRKPEFLGRSPDFADALVIWNWVRRMHMPTEANPDDEYQVDNYMKEYMKDEFDEDDATYSDVDEYDSGDYDE